MYRLIDAEGYRGQKVLVVGGGDSAVEAAIGLAQQPDNEVTLSYRREKLVRIKKKNEDRLAPLVAAGPHPPIFGSQVVEVLPDRVRLKIGDEVHELPNDYVFVFAGGEPPFDFLKRAACASAGKRFDAVRSGDERDGPHDARPRHRRVWNPRRGPRRGCLATAPRRPPARRRPARPARGDPRSGSG